LKQLAGLARQLGRYLAHSVSEEVSREDLFASFGFNSTGELLELCSAVSHWAFTAKIADDQFQVNSFTLSLPDVSPIGVTISPNVALANHSCDPNAVVVFPDGGRRMEVVAIRDIAPGEEVSRPPPDSMRRLMNRFSLRISTSRYLSINVGLSLNLPIGSHASAHYVSEI
jgi:SET and MYND domain-containing protein